MINNNWLLLLTYCKGSETREVTINPNNLSLMGATECSLFKTFKILNKNTNEVPITVHNKELFEQVIQKENIELKQFRQIILK